MTKVNVQYAVWPGSVTDYSGEVQEYTAEELAELYGVEEEDYLVISNSSEIPVGEAYLNYIHLKPRADGIYANIKDVLMDDDQVTTMGPDFDGDRKYIQETNQEAIDIDEDLVDNQS